MDINFKAFRKDFDEAVINLRQKYNLTIDLKNITYDDNGFTAKIGARSKDALPKIVTDYLSVKDHYNLPDIFTKFKDGYKDFEIIGYKRSARTYPILARCTQDGRNYKFGTDLIIRLTGGAYA